MDRWRSLVNVVSSPLAKDLLASQEGLCFMELVYIDTDSTSD
jgi:hypothetical protein